MQVKEISFTLPIGYEDSDGNFHRKGKMKQATALDEIEIYKNERIHSNQRYRDVLILSQVIIRLGDLNSIDPDLIENLYEVDFLFLQMLYNKLNKEMDETVHIRCPECHNIDSIFLPDLFVELHHYYQTNNQNKRQEVVIEEVKK